MTVPVLYADSALLAVCKPAGVPSEPLPGTPGVADLLTGEYGPLWLVHRLDRETAGVMVLARSREAAAALSRQITDGVFQKTYLAVTDGVPAAPTGEYRDLLFRDAKKGRSYIVDRERRGVREAVLTYETLAVSEGRALVRVALQTGRTHQIRVQFAGRGTPLCGDGRYGSKSKTPLALVAHKVCFRHPDTGAESVFTASPDAAQTPWDSFASVLTGGDNNG